MIDVMFYDEDNGEYFYVELENSASVGWETIVAIVEAAREELPDELRGAEFVRFDSPEIAELMGFDTY